VEQCRLRFGGACAVVGILIYTIAGSVHQDLSGRELGMEAVLHHAGEHPCATVHVTYMLPIVL
jgi:hypothetical protein